MTHKGWSVVKHQTIKIRTFWTTLVEAQSERNAPIFAAKIELAVWPWFFLFWVRCKFVTSIILSLKNFSFRNCSISIL